MWSIDEHVEKVRYATQLGDEWTEVEPGIFVRVERDRRLQAVDTEPADDEPMLKGAS